MANDDPPGAESVPVLMYHSIGVIATRKFRPYVVPPSLFREHLAALDEQGYTTLSVSEFARARRAGEVADHVVVLTFDDAFGDFATAALGALQAHHFTATLYVPTAYVGGRSSWLRAEGEADRAILHWSELADVAGAGIECGAHSHRHPQLDRIPHRELVEEIRRPKLILEDRLQRPVGSFAYPFGYRNRRVRAIVDSVGYDSCCAVRDLMSGPDDSLMDIPRITVTPDVSAEDLGELLRARRGTADDVMSQLRTWASYGLRRGGVRKRQRR